MPVAMTTTAITIRFIDAPLTTPRGVAGVSNLASVGQEGREGQAGALGAPVIERVRGVAGRLTRAYMPHSGLSRTVFGGPVCSRDFIFHPSRVLTQLSRYGVASDSVCDAPGGP